MGQPARLKTVHQIILGETRGTETSQYPEEEKEKIDFLSSGDRKGKSLNRLCYGRVGVVGAVKGTSQGTGSAWKRTAKRVKRPYR